ncbi:hypothetical protein DLM45_03510 [Hyphomicrobium methylovorum]|uniref:hypothetical protein n=1 Tax=Hyphomicrobium methylovorum TaxID=84 RepID=UPI0015E7A9BF|nr:hypothetical protein [Hyphomicrobium methylovorum]MBA2125290.1 hypothetical protein [Hyphomicrobium methylovorum]
MRNKTVSHVYDVLKAVYELEKELKTSPTLDEANRIDCSEHLRQARRQLHEVLDEVYSSDFRDRHAA